MSGRSSATRVRGRAQRACAPRRRGRDAGRRPPGAAVEYPPDSGLRPPRTPPGAGRLPRLHARNSTVLKYGLGYCPELHCRHSARVARSAPAWRTHVGTGAPRQTRTHRRNIDPYPPAHARRARRLPRPVLRRRRRVRAHHHVRGLESHGARRSRPTVRVHVTEDNPYANISNVPKTARCASPIGRTAAPPNGSRRSARPC